MFARFKIRGVQTTYSVARRQVLRGKGRAKELIISNR